MKRSIALIGLLGMFAAANAQHIQVHNSGNVMYGNATSSVDSIKLDATYSKFNIAGFGSLSIQKRFIDSITFSSSAVALSKIYIIYNGTENATIINPYAAQGVAITAVGGVVTVTGTSGIANLEYNLLGTSMAGSLTMSSTTPAIFVMNNLNLANAAGPAINVTGAQVHTFVAQAGTTNTLSDGSGNTKNGTLQTDGRIIVSGTGSLAITGVKKHGISTSAAIEVQNAALTIHSAASDGLHSEGFVMSGGTVTVAASVADGIDAGDAAISISNGTIHVTSTVVDVKALKTGNSTITITGGAINLNVSGNASKAMAAKGMITINGGTVGINLSGAAVLTASGSGFDPSYCTGIKSDGQININGGTITLQTTAAAAGAKGISADGNINITNGTFNMTTAGGGANYVNKTGVADSYSTTSFSTNSNINISGGNFTVSNSGADGKGFSSDAGINVTGGTITVTNSGATGRGFKADGEIVFNGGNTTVNFSGATVLAASGSGYDPGHPAGIKAKTVTINAGVVAVTGAASATGARGLSADSAINVYGGTVTISLAGNGAVYVNTLGVTDAYSSAAFSADSVITITGGTVTTTSSGTGGKGLKCDGKMNIGSATGNPVINLTTTGARFLVSGTDYSHPKTMVAAGAIVIMNGTVTAASTDDGIHSDASITISGGNHKITATSATAGVGEGIESPIINISGGVTNVTASNDGINATYGTVAGGTEANDNSQLNISGGILIVTGSDAIDSNGNITITGGTTIVCGPTSQPEEGIDYNGTFLMNGGILIAAGSNANMTKAMSTASTQVSMYLKSSAQLAATSLLHIENAAGTEMVTFKPKNAVYYFHFSNGSLLKNTQYKVYFGGTYTGGSYVGSSTGWGLYTGGTYSASGAVLKSTFTTAATATVNTVSF